MKQEAPTSISGSSSLYGSEGSDSIRSGRWVLTAGGALPNSLIIFTTYFYVDMLYYSGIEWLERMATSWKEKEKISLYGM